MMRMESERHNDGDPRLYQSPHSDRPVNRVPRSPISPINSSLVAEKGSGVAFIEHRVSKMDTLAGVAIKYGVEVADIKRVNGLVTDLQMFALKTLQIPTPGRHPPSPCLSSSSDTPGSSSSVGQSSSSRRHSDLFNSFQSLKPPSTRHNVSPAMSNLLGYYGLQPANGKTLQEGCEMRTYRIGNGDHAKDDNMLATPRPLSCHRKCRSMANGFPVENGELAGDSEPDKSNEKLRRRQKSEADFTSRAAVPEKASKGPALRPKASNADTGLLGDLFGGDGLGGVRKSSSTSNLQDPEGSNPLFMWPAAKWSLKPDLQVLSTAGIARPIFDGLPKPMGGRRNKAALD